MFEGYQVNLVLHHFKMPSCHKSVPSVVAWSHKNADTLLLNLFPIILPNFFENPMSDLSHCQACKFHESFRGKRILVHKGFIKELVEFPSAICELFHQDT